MIRQITLIIKLKLCFGSNLQLTPNFSSNLHIIITTLVFSLPPPQKKITSKTSGQIVGPECSIRSLRCSYDSPVFNGCLFHNHSDTRPNVESFLWPISFLHILKATHTVNVESIKRLDQQKRRRRRIKKGEESIYLFVQDHHVLPDLCILVYDAFPSVKEDKHQTLGTKTLEQKTQLGDLGFAT